MSGENNENELARFDSQNRTQNGSIQYNRPQKDNCCCLCRMFRWFFEPLCRKLGYSLTTMCFQLINFTVALAAFIFVCTALSVSVGLVVVMCVGVALYYFCCEITLVIARIDLWITFYMVEDDEMLLKKRAPNLQISLVHQMPSCSLCWKRCCCPCIDPPATYRNSDANNNVKNDNQLSWFDIIRKRVKTLFFSCRMIVIYLYFLLIKPVVTLLTCWTFFLVVYAGFILIIPPWYLINDHYFKSGMLCPFGYSNCDNGDCHCHGLKVDNYNVVLLCLVVGLVSLPLSLRINNYSAYVSKIVTYFFLTQFFKYGIADKDEQQLLYENNV